MTMSPPLRDTRETAPAMVVSDLDGTLLDIDGRVSARNIAALNRAAEAGAHVLIATGRSPSTLTPIIDAGFTGLAVCMNGAVLFDVGAGRILDAAVMAPPTMTTFVDDLDRLAAEFALAVDRIEEHTETFWAEPTYRHPWSDRDFSALDRDDLLAEPAAKMLVHFAAPPEDAVVVARSAAAERVSVTYSCFHGLMEVAAAGVSKGALLARLAGEWGVDAADVVAFGDMPNDIEMLSWAGRSVAMANAHPEVAAAAVEVGPHHAEDGVAQVLERWF